MKKLAIDTSNGLASFALQISQETYFISNNNQANQYEDFYSLLKQILNQAKITLFDLDMVCVTSGPGSFTGIRIGLAATLGLRQVATNFEQKTKFVSISNFQVIAAILKKHKFANLRIMIHSMHNLFYVQMFNNDLIKLSEPEIIEVADGQLIKEPNFTSAVHNYSKATGDFNISKLDALNVLEALNLYDINDLSLDLHPLYVKQPNIKLK